jgi:aryl-alcohol dehydrogenase-like predicted oxidoreductase
MEYVPLGTSSLAVSQIALGCMSYGVEARTWHLDAAASRDFIRHALELGITMFDTADMYGAGESEIVLGRALKDFARRDEVVVATKVYYPVKPGDEGGLSRAAIHAGIDASLTRLGMDYVALPACTRPLSWLLAKPVVTAPIVGATRMEHLDDAVRSLSVRLEPQDLAALEAEYMPHARNFF